MELESSTAVTAEKIEVLLKPGYHLSSITRGTLGEISKIREELDELEDALRQGSKIMAAVELADLVGAIEHFLKKQLPGTTIEDLILFSRITQRAFENGHRSV